MIKTPQRGFTLIELVVVIVILGILAAFAVPRFMGMEGEARGATVKNLAGTLRASSTMGHAKCLAQGCGTTAANIPFENTFIIMANSYPNAATIVNTIQGAIPAAGATPASFPGWILSNPGGNVNVMRFRKDGGQANCYVEYVSAVNVNTPPVIRFQGAAVIGVNATEQSVAANLSVACQG